ncbi:hypothetical protein U27_01310 [Candidatus Vecturithrix granuli]|uniref:Hemerythrin-like domain-containing protein n=1 Tax=Vecturithrix granuli TaxID=1499967 RepID=A0A081CA05_VECG1|nr:hypothetical protein U27_01310 [Candidatus Vecturithrix granuli]
MAFMQWDDQYSVGIKVIDDQHKRLFAMIQDFYDQMRQKHTREGISTLLKGLADYSLYHFNSEEALMTRHQYPGYLQHKNEHTKFIQKVEEFRLRFDSGQLLIPIEIAEFLKTWLSNHILKTDQQFAPFLREIGVK